MVLLYRITVVSLVQQYDLGDQRYTLLENVDHVYANTYVIMV